MQGNDLLRAALRYLKAGFSVIPVRPEDKKPYVMWEPFQKRHPTPQEVEGWWQRWPTAMIGIVTGSISGVVVIDVDTEEGYDAIQRYIPDWIVTPTCQTPKGGQHLYFKCPDKPLGNNSRVIPGCDFRGEGGYVIGPPSKNSGGKGYVWRDGLSLGEVAPAALPEPYISFISKNALGFRGGIGGKRVGDFNRLQVTSTDFMEGKRDETLFHIANCLIKGGMAEEETEQLIEIISQKCCDPPFPINEAREKIRSALRRADRRVRSIAEEVRDFILTSSGFFLTSDCFNRLQVTSRDEKKAVVLALLRFKKDGLIERHGEKNGCYRKIEEDFEEIEIDDTEDKPVNIRIGLGLDDKVILYERNIAVISGSFDSGKTAYLLNLAFDNRNAQKVRYISSEMGKPELKARLRAFGHGMDEWRKIKFIDRSTNFVDIIDPAGLNIIDFLELTQDVYLVAEHLKNIYQKLTTGIAFVAIQKKKDSELGRGAEFSAEKPRLYLSFDPGRIRIVKAKNWRDSTLNPRGLELRFKLVGGHKFIPDGDWYRP